MKFHVDKRLPISAVLALLIWTVFLTLQERCCTTTILMSFHCSRPIPPSQCIAPYSLYSVTYCFSLGRFPISFIVLLWQNLEMATSLRAVPLYHLNSPPNPSVNNCTGHISIDFHADAPAKELAQLHWERAIYFTRITLSNLPHC